MVKKLRHSRMREQVLGLIIACGACAGALAFAAGVGVDNLSQLASGMAADAMCMGGADAECQCGKGKKDGKCDPKKSGGGKIGCPCKDITSGDVAASGKCAAVGKCKADKADGMPPMLPMLPMPMPKMMMPMMMMPMPCKPKTATSTGATATSTNATTTDKDPIASAVRSQDGASDPNCDQGGGGGGSFAYPDFSWGTNQFGSQDDAGSGSDDTAGTSNGSSSLWGRLMQSLGISNDSGDEEGGESGTTYAPAKAGKVTSKTKQSGTTTPPGTQTTKDFSGSGSTFTYEEEIDAFAGETASVLDAIAAALRRLLSIVNSWL